MKIKQIMSKFLKNFENQSAFEAYMAGENDETVFPNVCIVDGEKVKYGRLLPTIDTTDYVTTFVSGKHYEKEGKLFKMIFDNFAEGYDPEIGDAAIWLDLYEATADVFLYTNRQTFSIANEPLYTKYLSKITNFWDENGTPSSTLNIFPDYVSRDEVNISDGASQNVFSKLNYNDGFFEETVE